MSIQLQNRFKRIKGQLDSLQSNIDTGGACDDVIPQFLAVKGAFNAAFELYLQEAVGQCGSKDTAKLSKLISILAKK